MKNKSLKAFASAYMLAGGLLLAVNGNSQERKLPDGSIVYSDGTRRFPNGTIIYKDGNSGNNGNVNQYPSNNGGVRLPDGTIVYPDGSKSYPDHRKNRRNKDRGNNQQWLPPGQAKKIYGGSARDYAPGQQKKRHGNVPGNGKFKRHND